MCPHERLSWACSWVFVYLRGGCVKQNPIWFSMLPGRVELTSPMELRHDGRFSSGFVDLRMVPHLPWVCLRGQKGASDQFDLEMPQSETKLTEPSLDKTSPYSSQTMAAWQCEQRPTRCVLVQLYRTGLVCSRKLFRNGAPAEINKMGLDSLGPWLPLVVERGYPKWLE